MITHFNISPGEINFEGVTDQVFDTTLTINITGQINQISENTLTYFSITDIQNDQKIDEGNLNLFSVSQGIGNFDQDLSLTVSTSTINNFLVIVIATDVNGNGNYAQSALKVNGISNSPPEILEVENPSEYPIPQSGTENIRFTAKVADKDGQSNIEGVFLRLISRTSGEATNSPYELYDDGQSFGDMVASDSVFTLTFPVSSENQPDTYDIHYFAADRAGLVSDTVKTTFTLVE
ncbi:MAG: hypothetical protein U5K71_07035 [Gracilimonas sp.]|nr:hypothetical protein [Gracilimonas sp.]